MRIASTIGSTAVNHDGAEYTADDDGIFEVPEHVGNELTSFPDWVPEHVAVAAAAAEQAARDNDVARLSGRVADLEQGLADALERIVALEPPEKPLTAAEKKAAAKAAEPTT